MGAWVLPQRRLRLRPALNFAQLLGRAAWDGGVLGGMGQAGRWKVTVAAAQPGPAALTTPSYLVHAPQSSLALPPAHLTLPAAAGSTVAAYPVWRTASPPPRDGNHNKWLQVSAPSRKQKHWGTHQERTGSRGTDKPYTLDNLGQRTEGVVEYAEATETRGQRQQARPDDARYIKDGCPTSTRFHYRHHEVWLTKSG